MGLDMMLYKKKKNLVADDELLEVAYWRKANQIHNWFVKNVQNGLDDCGYYEVSITKLKELKEICDKILKEVMLTPGKITMYKTYDNDKEQWINKYGNGMVIANKETCEELLPTTEGFFFGSTDYDSYYLNDIKDTSKMLDKIINETKEDEELEYHSSW